MNWSFLILGFLVFLEEAQGFSDKETTLNGATYKWTHSAKFPSGMEVSWIGTDPDWITFEMKAPTKGYVAVGFSPTGGMTGADIFLGWVDASLGTTHIMDMFATHNGRPLVDKQQDLDLIGGWENENGTGIVFRRRWDTCGGEEDFPIGEDTMRMIWAIEDSDPEWNDDGSFHPKFHGKDVMKRGVKSTFMKVKPRHRKFPDEEDVYPKNMFHADLTVTNVVVPKLETYYHCKIVKFPKLAKKHHIVAYRPLIAPATIPHIHHINIYKCHVPEVLRLKPEDIFEKYMNHHGGDCYTQDSPKEWTEYCFEFRVAVGVGSEGDLYPDHLGDVIGDNDGPTYYRIEVHYENPQGKELVDSSGIRLFYTSTLRQYEVAVLFAGHRRTPFLTIPPHQKAYTTYGFCSSECTKQGIPRTGIKLISVLLHAHLTGRKIVLRHIRNGKELPPVAYDNHIDFNYQHYRQLTHEVTILPGDELITECTFDTEKNDTFVYGGLSTRREMCESFIYYYPKSALIDCRSQPEFYSYFNAIGVQNATGKLLRMMHLPLNSKLLPENLQDLALADDSMVLENGRANDVPHDVFRDVIINRPANLEGFDVHDHMMTLNWDDEEFVRSVERKRKTGYHYMHCSSPGAKKIHTSRDALPFPVYEPYEVPEKPCLLAGSGASSRYPFAWVVVLISASVSWVTRFF